MPKSVGVRYWTRRKLANNLGITYSTFRVYERSLGDLVHPKPPYRGTAPRYSSGDREMLLRAIKLKKMGHPFKFLRTEILRMLDESQDPHPGHINLRVDPDVHEALKVEARDKGLSLNTYLVSIIGERGRK